MVVLPFLNLGSGRTKFPGERPVHHALIPAAIYDYPKYLNISRNASENPDCVMDLFAYPWPLESDSYGGAIAAHLCEHIPHVAIVDNPKDYTYRNEAYSQSLTKAYYNLLGIQDSWFCFFSELHRVLVDGALVYTLQPHAFSFGAHSDPTHTRYLLPETFSHSMRPDPNAPFEYATGNTHFEVENVTYGLTHYFTHLAPLVDDTPAIAAHKQAALEEAAATRVNVISEFAVTLRCVKP